MDFQTVEWIHLLSSSVIAYLDPGSGSFILQLVLATILGSMFVFKNTWKKLVNFFRKFVAKDEKEREE